jgi:hypothetical protein
MSDASGEQKPLLRVISGDATEEEIAAVLAIVLARSGGDTEPEPEQTSTWATPSVGHRGVRGQFAVGRDGWRTSYWPR